MLSLDWVCLALCSIGFLVVLLWFFSEQNCIFQMCFFHTGLSSCFTRSRLVFPVWPKGREKEKMMVLESHTEAWRFPWCVSIVVSSDCGCARRAYYVGRDGIVGATPVDNVMYDNLVGLDWFDTKKT